jgi:NAD(P)-dependent dehydrogenase (short-subunit alcohol dehydrogenase family)
MESGNRPITVITGGSRGIGAATAIRLARAGHHLAVAYRDDGGRSRAPRGGGHRRGHRLVAQSRSVVRDQRCLAHRRRPGVPLRVPADDDVAHALVPLAGLRHFRSDTVAVLDEAAAAESLEPVGTAWTAGGTLAQTPNTVADSIERRLWSYLWYVDELTWQAVVAPVVAALRTLPEPNRPRQYDASSRLVVFARGDATRGPEPAAASRAG